MLDEVRRRINHPRYEDLIVGDFRAAQILPLMGMAGIGRFERQARRARPHAHVKDLGERDVVGVRPFVITPAEMHPHRLGRNIGSRVIECGDVALGNAQKLLVREVLILVVAGGAEIGCVDLQDEAGSGDCLVFFLQGVGQCLDVGVFIPVIPIGDEFRQHPG